MPWRDVQLALLGSVADVLAAVQHAWRGYRDLLPDNLILTPTDPRFSTTGDRLGRRIVSVRSVA